MYFLKSINNYIYNILKISKHSLSADGGALVSELADSLLGLESAAAGTPPSSPTSSTLVSQRFWILKNEREKIKLKIFKLDLRRNAGLAHEGRVSLHRAAKFS